MAVLPGFPSHGSGLRLGAGCQQWKLLGITGTQPPVSNAVVNTFCMFNLKSAYQLLELHGNGINSNLPSDF